MKNILRKTQQKIYAIWRKAKQHISSFVGGQFKKRQYNDHRDIDWYYQELWFDRKWFKHKLKRFIMKNVYNFIDNVENFLHKYTYELYHTLFLIKVVPTTGLVIGRLPLILKVKNGVNPEPIVLEISDQLDKEFGYKTYPDIQNIKKIRNNEELDIITRQMEIDFENCSAVGEVIFNTILAKPKMSIDNVIPITIDSSEIPMGFKILNKDIIKFGVVETKDKRKYINHENKFQIFIKFDTEIKKVIDEQPTEIRLDRIKELMGLKIDKVNDKPDEE